MGVTDLVLEFWWYDHGDEGDSPDIVEIRGSSSDDWIEVYNFGINSNNGSWTYASIDIDAFLTSNTQTLASTFAVRFGQNDNFPINTDGITIDDIVIFREGITYTF